MTPEKAFEIVSEELRLTNHLIDMYETDQFPNAGVLERQKEWRDALLCVLDCISKVVNRAEDGKPASITPVLHSRCLRCGKVLKSPVAQERGYGEVCWKKHLIDKQTTLF